jgi:hypothetical protein
VTNILRSPLYTGAYVYGRRESRPVIVGGVLRGTRSVPLAEKDWQVCIRDHHPAYISWEEYVENRRRLQENRSNWVVSGAPRKGAALLQGLAHCGKCGYRMSVGYARNGPTYSCRGSLQHSESTTRCWGLAGWRVEKAVVEAFLEVAQPQEIELSLAVRCEAMRQAEEVDQQWRLRLERARYEASLAERRYKAVDPDNRNVARTVETEWEHRLSDLVQVERGHEVARQERKVQLSDADRARIMELARDLAAVWHAPTTTAGQRKTLLRTLISGVTLTPVDLPTRQTRVQILWEGGAVTELLVARPRAVAGRQAAPKADARLRSLVEGGATDLETARSLNAEGHTTGTGRRWDRESVRRVRRRLGLQSPQAGRERAPFMRSDGLYSGRGVARFFGVSESTVVRWSARGWLPAVEAGDRGKSAWYRLDEEVIGRVEEHSSKARSNRK